MSTTGAQTATSETVAFAKRSLGHASGATERLLGVRSVESLMQVQGGFLRASYESVFSQTSRMGELAVTIARKASAPVEGLFAKTPATS